MKPAAYTPEQLRTHRASHFVFGGTQEARRAWAEDAAGQLDGEGPLAMVQFQAQLPALLARARGVVFVPDVLSLDWEAQGLIVQCLRRQEERARWVLGLPSTPDRSVQGGALRPDLWFCLRAAQVDAGSPEVQAMLRQRKSRAALGGSRPRGR